MRLVIALALLLLVGCGGAPAGSPTPTPRPTPTPVPTAPTLSAECADELEGVMEALEQMKARLDIGLNRAAYSERLGDISVAYNRLDATELAGMGPACISTAATLEDAYNAYITASNEWSDCFNRTGCTLDSIESSLQEHWAEASDLIDEARQAFP